MYSTSYWFERRLSRARSSSLVLVLFAATLVIAGSACGDGSECETDSDCAANETCAANGGVLFGEVAGHAQNGLSGGRSRRDR